jgi:hypothetical protein
MKDNKVNLKINLYNWKKKLLEILSSKNYIKRSLYLIIEQSFIDYLNKYLYDDNNSIVKDFGEIININDLSKIKDSKTDLSKFPKLFVLNKDSIPSSQHNNIENRKLNSIYYDHLLRIEITELIYCIFFLDKNNQLRQGYLRKKKHWFYNN